MKKKIEKPSKEEKMHNFLVKSKNYIIISISLILAIGIAVSVYFTVMTNNRKSADESYFKLASTLEKLDSDLVDEADLTEILEKFSNYENEHKNTFNAADFAFRIAEYYKKDSNYDEAIKFYDSALANKPKSFQKNMILLNKAMVLLETSKIDEGFEILKKMQTSKKFEYIDYVNFKLGQCYEHFDNSNDAIDAYSRILKEKDDEEDVYSSKTLENLAKTRIMQINLGSELFKFEKEAEIFDLDETNKE
ncbi:MAG: tetratricopeptide repeat protein [Spirochaetales bacterium]|nr:tetratricopeptide repeat protein [Spirochaetales bacterium]